MLGLQAGLQQLTSLTRLSLLGFEVHTAGLSVADLYGFQRLCSVFDRTAAAEERCEGSSTVAYGWTFLSKVSKVMHHGHAGYVNSASCRAAMHEHNHILEVMTWTPNPGVDQPWIVAWVCT